MMGRTNQKVQHRRGLLHDLAGEGGSGIVQPLGQAGVVHQAGLVDLRLVLIGKDDLVGFNVHTADVLLLGHGHKGAVVHLFDLALLHPWQQHKVEEQQHQQHEGVVDRQRLARCLDFFHRISSSVNGLALSVCFAASSPKGRAFDKSVRGLILSISLS